MFQFFTLECSDGSESPDLEDEWRIWHMHDPELESEEEADEE